MSDFFKVTSWDAKALFSMNIQSETCAICRANLQENCLECQGMEIETKCGTAIGKCNHSFHFHCISHWLKKQQKCPLCQQEWAFVKYS